MGVLDKLELVHMTNGGEVGVITLIFSIMKSEVTLRITIVSQISEANMIKMTMVTCGINLQSIITKTLAESKKKAQQCFSRCRKVFVSFYIRQKQRGLQ